MSNRYIDILGEAMPTVRNAASLVSPSGDARNDHAYTDLAVGVVAGAGGAHLWKKHRILGFIAGHSIGGNAFSLARGEEGERKAALCSMGVGAAVVGGSLLWKEHPVIGGLAGYVSGMLLTAYIPNSPMQQIYLQAVEDNKASEAKRLGEKKAA